METALTYFLPPLKKQRHKFERIFEIDFLRGFAIFLMILLHGCCAFGDVYPGGLITLPGASENLPGVQKAIDFAFTYPNGVFALIDYGNLWILEFFFSSLFMFLCGISCSFSHNNYERGIKLAFVSLFITLMLELLDQIFHLDIHIYCGILQSLALGILVYALIDHFCGSYLLDFILGTVFAILDIVTVYFVYSGINTISMAEATLPTASPMTGEYSKQLLHFIAQLLSGTGRYGADYFSPVNTFAFVFLGATVGKTLYRNKQSVLRHNIPTAWAKPILWCGSNSLIVYVFHMPFFYLLLALILLPFGYRINF
jgi:uncharacterized membrane protein